MFILTIAAVRALLSALLSCSLVLLICFMYIFLWTIKMMMMLMMMNLTSLSGCWELKKRAHVAFKGLNFTFSINRLYKKK